MRVRLFASLLLLGLPSPALGQTSASYKLVESTVNAGGDPSQGAFAASASHRIRLDAVGGVVGAGLSSTSHRLDGGFVSFFPPPSEVRNQTFTSKTTMTWSPDRSVGQYELYRDPMSALAGGGTGACFASSLAAESATDVSTPAAGTGYFYLVTARNRLGEEGTKGFRTSGSERPNTSPCP